MALATFDNYMLSIPRNELSQSSNDATNDNPPHPYANDAGNWTGCQIYAGMLVGTYRDVSACMLSSELGRPCTKQDLKSLTFNDVKTYFRPYWDAIGAGQLTSQEVANIYMHIRLHYGNIHVAQRALNKLGENLTVDGSPGPLTKAAMERQTRKNALKTYNTIREELRISYSSNPNYGTSFVNQLNRYFPVLTSTSSSSSAAMGSAAVGVLLLGAAAGYYYYNKKKKTA